MISYWDSVAKRLRQKVRLVHGERALFIKQKEVNLYGRRAYAYIVLDSERKGRETKKLLLDTMEEGENKVKRIFQLLMRELVCKSNSLATYRTLKCGGIYIGLLFLPLLLLF